MMRTQHLILILIRDSVTCILQRETGTLGLLLGRSIIVVVSVKLRRKRRERIGRAQAFIQFERNVDLLGVARTKQLSGSGCCV